MQYYLPAYDLLIAADSGLDTALQFGLVPDFVIGDMDSVKDNLFIQACDKTRTHLFPRDKDFTDTEL
ncbi:thiamine diphosphokinase, partial [Treponema pallidum]